MDEEHILQQSKDGVDLIWRAHNVQACEEALDLPVPEALGVPQGFFFSPEPHFAFFSPIFVLTHFFLCLNPILGNGSFCPSSPFDLPKCRTIIRVRVCVKTSLAERLTFPNVKNDAGNNTAGRRRLHKNTAYAHLWGFNRPMFSRKAG